MYTRIYLWASKGGFVIFTSTPHSTCFHWSMFILWQRPSMLKGVTRDVNDQSAKNAKRKLLKVLHVFY